jgi:hypothetical protein
MVTTSQWQYHSDNNDGGDDDCYCYTSGCVRLLWWDYGKMIKESGGGGGGNGGGGWLWWRVIV